MSCEHALLRVEALRVSFAGRRGRYSVVRDLGMEVGLGETLCIVGESGSGKSVTALAIMGLLAHANGQIDTGSILYDGEDLVSAGAERMREIRGGHIGMVFQEPMTSLNPVLTIGDQIAEALLCHKNIRRTEAMDRALEMLNAVGIPAARQRLRDYPHQLSGGMRQRVMIAMALIARPRVLIADEPTTALDVTVQAQILDLLQDLQSRLGMSLVLITHNMGIVADIAKRVVVLYAGRKVEDGPANHVLTDPKHPYTRALIDCSPRLDGAEDEARAALAEIPGMMPNLGRSPKGCIFAPRCSRVVDRCRQEVPPTVLVGAGHSSACWLAGESGVP